MLRIEFECRLSARDEDNEFTHSVVVRQNNPYKFNIELNLAIMRLIVEHGDYAKIHEHEEREKNGELPF